MKKDFFASKKVKSPAFVALAAGQHLVRIARYAIVDSLTNYDGSEKENDKPWDVPTPQLAVTIVAAEEGKSGAITHRLNGLGFKRFDELTEKEQKSGKFQDLEGYACIENEDGLIERVEDPVRTEACDNILMQFMASINAKQDAEVLEELDRAIIEQTAFQVTVTVEDFDGKSQSRAGSFKKAAVAVDLDSDF
jgi:hypothetical protein